MRLNLGCGADIRPGWTNVDKHQSCGADEIWDIRSLPLEDESVDAILALHVVESFYRWELLDVLKEWNRVLKLGGTLVIEATDRDVACKWARSKDEVQRRRGLRGLYGDQEMPEENPDTLHKYTYAKSELFKLLLAAGFYQTRLEQAKTHVRARDFRVESRK